MPYLNKIHQLFQLLLLMPRKYHGFAGSMIISELHSGSGVDGVGKNISKTIERLEEFHFHGVAVKFVFDTSDPGDDVVNVSPYDIKAMRNFVGVDIGVAID